MKRKAEEPALVNEKKPLRKRSKTSLSPEETKKRFRQGLFDQAILDKYTSEYTTSTPYKHAVIHKLIDDSLLRGVRDEIRENVSFTPKETDIYKIHQSGDLANLDGLEDEALSKLPSLLALRDALYSETFRNYVSHITGCGHLSGRKTDMAINVYTPGCFLLCHDDVIGSRKVSYILYLTDPDTPWQPSWGGALRLFPVSERIDAVTGVSAKITGSDVVKAIPPAWNQLSFFAVQPGESFHDVQEVYHAESSEVLENDAGRVRMAVSGWFHIPQIGEEGYVKGAEEKLAENSGLMQLQGNPDQFDLPPPQLVAFDKKGAAQADWEAADLDFLAKYISPNYLIPDALDQIAEHFDEHSSIVLPNILSTRFAQRLRAYVEDQEARPLPSDSTTIEKSTPWKVARPPHKHRFLYQQPSGPDELRTSQEESPITELLDVLLPSRQFRQWLQIATKCVLGSRDLLARRFRRGEDYTLATGYDGKERLEVNLGFTPTTGWGEADEDEDEEYEDEDDEDEEIPAESSNGNGKGKGKAVAQPKENGSKSKGRGKGTEEQAKDPLADPEDVGGHEVYMAGDDDADDAAVYKTSSGSAADDNILFFQSASWNTMTIVLRDTGILRFVKYVSKSAPGDRWDVLGLYGVVDGQGEGWEGEASGSGSGTQETGLLDSSEEEEFNGFSDDVDSDSD